MKYMYNLQNLSLGQKIKICRMKKGLNVDDLAKRIIKSKNAVYKYECDAVIPDAITLMEICNALNIEIEELLNDNILKEQKDKIINIFKTNKLYLYYISDDSIVASVLYITNDKVYLYNGIKSKKDINNCAYIFTGNVRMSTEKAVFHLENIKNKNNNELYDEVDIKLNLKFKEKEIYMGSISGINLNNKDFVKKCIVTKNFLNKNELLKNKDKLYISNKEMDMIGKKGYWEIETRQMADFYVKQDI